MEKLLQADADAKRRKREALDRYRRRPLFFVSSEEWRLSREWPGE